MRRVLLIISILLPLCCCTKKAIVPADPDVIDDGRTEVRASIADYAGSAFIWQPSSRIGIYDSEGRENVRYTLQGSYAGKDGEVSLYGPTIGGSLVAYYPYSSKGYRCVADHRQPVLAEQVAGASASQHLALNAVLVAEAGDDGRFLFSYEGGNTGLLHLSLNCPVEGPVRKVVIHCPGAPLAGSVSLSAEADPLVSDGSHYLTLTEVGRPCTASAPLEVWGQVPAGRYEHLTITVFSAEGSATASIAGPVNVPAGGSADASAGSAPSDASNEDLTIIDGTYE